ncbi:MULTISPECIES: bifunctional phosphopantothenoylcysteine decarboxylase/phosphopantothenate--cysteine ligase CoaBC [unclassified Methanoculleus]|uniref:bifunctional phosphopantothenoylcysteine decarboxylase/phosphopantothenate--cysteine ligase CoaBC n=1 Tax=unclassified Methanoculleus TaxID=2619537 RepID=UPI0025F45DF6|nr:MULTISPECIES: bifunctional phosphopantothenoylcysteine decarboxylase/phosphopantothenate--cysteine ligase CoaBC [unclassified Methanoculleus]MCK9316865.1 bifunctional phosphopantothenoylcysteine decarboxylase/phosphopantothenate--cysteine ligase CoaBC [Methanoculleus sp.]MDD2253927.1 bifunctional phosphopantothenoylcysteine decarboxylase/phosphopantothenate--cysteine ligase CoaBC [Methanoculleus sp.]MDD2786890.1 bifunctional phosphopantothenoylcysteine decarboxylase/phosphopantothenate--cyste
MKTLSGKTVVLAVTGSIAAVETVKLAHALRREGATVQAVMTEAAAGIIHPDALAYATARPVVTRITGLVEHVLYCGEGGAADLLLIAPSTANTIGKIACGIDDTPVTTFATTALGRGMPVVLAPAMHESMYRHPGVAENLRRLRSWGIEVIDPRIEEGKAKVADNTVVVLHAERAVSGRPLAGKKVLITSGACAEPLDDVRVLTTRSTGRMGRALALEAFRLGADVTVVHAGSFPCIRNIRVTTAAEMREAVLSVCRNEGVDVYVSAAAISDFAPERREGKIPSGSPRTVRLNPLPKIIDEVMAACRPVTVAFKLGWHEEERARAMLEAGARMVVVNAPPAMGAAEGSFRLMTAGGVTDVTGSKEEVAAAVWSGLL